MKTKCTILVLSFCILCLKINAQFPKIPKGLKKIGEKVQQLGTIIEKVDKLTNPQNNQTNPNSTNQNGNNPINALKKQNNPVVLKVANKVSSFNYKGIKPVFDYPIGGDIINGSFPIAVTPDDKYVIGLQGERILFTDTKTAKLAYYFNLSNDSISVGDMQTKIKIQFSKDGTKVAFITPSNGLMSLQKTGFIHIIDLVDFNVLFSIKAGGSGLNSVSPDFKYAVIKADETGDGGFDVWDINSAKILHNFRIVDDRTLPVEYNSLGSTFAGSDEKLIFSTQEKGIEEVDILTTKITNNFSNINQSVAGLNIAQFYFTNNNKILVNGGNLTLNYPSGDRTGTEINFEGVINYSVYDNGNKLLTNHKGEYLKYWDLQSGNLLKEQKLEIQLIYVTISNSGKTVFGYTHDLESLIFSPQEVIINRNSKSLVSSKVVFPTAILPLNNGYEYLIGFKDGSIKRLNLKSQSIENSFKLPKSVAFIEYDNTSKKLFATTGFKRRAESNAVSEWWAYYEERYYLDLDKKQSDFQLEMKETTKYYEGGNSDGIGDVQRVRDNEQGDVDLINFRLNRKPIDRNGVPIQREAKIENNSVLIANNYRLFFLDYNSNDYIVFDKNQKFSGTENGIKELYVNISNNKVIKSENKAIDNYTTNLLLDYYNLKLKK